MSDFPHSELAKRVAELEATAPQLRAKVSFYTTEAGGRNTPAPSGIGFPCKLLIDSHDSNDAMLLFDRNWVEPGSTTEAKFFFLLGEEVAARFRSAQRFYLWEGGIIAEALVIPLER